MLLSPVLASLIMATCNCFHLVRNGDRRHSISPRLIEFFFFDINFRKCFRNWKKKSIRIREKNSRLIFDTNDSTYSSKQLWWPQQQHRGRISIQWQHWHTLAPANCRTRWTACQTLLFHRLPVRLSFYSIYDQHTIFLLLVPRYR